MILNPNGWLGGTGAGGGSTTINVTGSQNSIVQTSAEMNNITSPKNGDVCYVVTDKILYMYNNDAWNTIPTVDMFYNKLASTSDVGHVQLTSDITLESEDMAVTPKALKVAIDEVKTLINNSSGSSQWDDLSDGEDETESDLEWNNW